MRTFCFALTLLSLFVVAPTRSRPEDVTVRANSTVRGQLYRRAPNGQAYVAQGLAVRLNHPAYGPSAFAYSGSDGMYYLQNVPPGQFILEVWLTSRPEDVLRFNVSVDGRPMVDVPPIQVP